MTSLPERLVELVAGRSGPDRRGFLRGSAIVGAALASAPVAYLTRPLTAYAAVCGADSTCASGYSVFCCTINGGRNTCPPNSFIGGWWKADSSSFCGGAARYYIDCNAFKNNNPYGCRCNDDPNTCDHRRVACNQFRYGQCSPEVPLSNTGPVVCRMVSCSPPWQQFAGTCSSASRTDNQTATHSAPCLAGNVPIGRLDSVTVDRDGVRLRGWALDQDAPSSSVRIAVSYDTVSLGVFTTDIVRADVNAAYKVTGAHGFDVTVVPAGGTRTLQVHALNLGPGIQDSPLIGSATVKIPPDKVPVGRLDTLTTSGNQVKLAGWTFDGDHPTTAIQVDVQVDGVSAGRFATTVLRSDVNKAFGITGNHGFDVSVNARNGNRRIDLYAINAGPGTRAPLLASRTVNVNPGALPVGRVDTVQVDGERVVLSGWAYDPDAPASSIQVAVYQDSTTFLGWLPTGVPRPDVNAARGITGNHGFVVAIGSPPGSHTYQVYGINVGGGASNPLIGTITARVGDAGGIGRVDEVSVVGTSVRLRGWAFDQTSTGTAIPIGVVVDGGTMTQLPTGLPRADVNAVYGITGNHGFDQTLTLSPGTRNVTVFAITAGGPALVATERVTV